MTLDYLVNPVYDIDAQPVQLHPTIEEYIQPPLAYFYGGTLGGKKKGPGRHRPGTKHNPKDRSRDSKVGKWISRNVFGNKKIK